WHASTTREPTTVKNVGIGRRLVVGIGLRQCHFDRCRRALDEPLDEVECGLSDLAPAVVDRERVATVRDLDDLCHGWGATFLVVCRRHWRSPMAPCGPSRHR